MSAATPYLSIVIAGRNDNYGGDFEERLVKCITWTGQMLARFNFSAEILLVNYNPVADRPALEDVIKWPTGIKQLTVRYITVSKEIHEEVQAKYGIKKLPFHEYIAKNAGIRRALGEYVLCINPDVIIHPEIFKAIAEKSLDKDFFYRADRFDHHKIETPVTGIDSYLSAASKATFRMFMMGHIVPFRIANIFALRVFRKLNQLYCRFKNYLNYYLSIAKPFSYPYLQAEWFWHCNASGDFMLMHNNHWQQLGGYPESLPIPLHVDATFVVKTGVYGLQQKTFFHPVFHQNHDRRYDTGNMDAEMRSAFETFYEISYDMMQHKQKSSFFKPNEAWGLKDYILPETLIDIK